MRIGITGKLFMAIFATCMLVLITMHWGVRASFERGFIDYIKQSNEQRIAMLGDALKCNISATITGIFCVTMTKLSIR